MGYDDDDWEYKQDSDKIDRENERIDDYNRRVDEGEIYHTPRAPLSAKKVAIALGICLVIALVVVVIPNISIPTIELESTTQNNLQVIKTLKINEEGGNKATDGYKKD
jgi:hypothetical protein